MNKFIKYICLAFIISISVFYAGMNNAKAMGTPDGNGYAKCFYSCPETAAYSHTIGINVFRNTEDNYDGYAMIYTRYNYNTSDKREAAFDNDNYTSIFNNSDYLKEKFYPNNSWECPSFIFSGATSAGDQSVTIAFSGGVGYSSCPLTSNESSQSGYKSLDESEVSSEEKAIVDGNGLTKNDKKADIDKIKSANKSCHQIKTGDDVIYYDADNNPITEEEFEQECINYESTDCSIFGDELIDFLKKLFWIISIAGIILLVVMTMVEFVKALTGSDDSGLIKGFKHTFVRIVAVIILLLLPTIITFILTLVNRYSDYKIGEDGNVICGVGER